MDSGVGTQGGEDLLAVVAMEHSAVEEGDESTRFSNRKDGSAQIHEGGRKQIKPEPILPDGFVVLNSGGHKGML